MQFLKIFLSETTRPRAFIFGILGGVLNPNSFGGFLTIFSLFVNNCKSRILNKQCLIEVLYKIVAKKYLMFLLPQKFTPKSIVQ